MSEPRKVSARIDLTRLDVGGKIPPQAVDIEERVLGAIMLDKTAFEKAHILKPEYFYSDTHQYIFEACVSLNQANHPIDMDTVIEELKKNGMLDIVGGFYKIAQITGKVSSTANVEYHCAIIAEKYNLREIIRVSAIAMSAAYEDSGDPFEIQSGIYTELEKTQLKHTVEPTPIANIYAKNIKDLSATQNAENQMTGIDTGYTALNEMTHGWHDTDLVIIAARPSTGKTALALNLVYNAAMKGKKCAIFSLEMSAKQLVNRMTAMVTGIKAKKFRSADLDSADWTQLHSNDLKLPIWVDDTHSLGMIELKSKSRRLKRLHDIELIVIDYLQLLKAEIKGSNREGEISYISRSLKGLAKELKIPIIALAQLSRDVEKRKGGEPILSDLRESGSIEQDADMVGFLFNPNDDKEMAEPIINLIIAKQREGPTGTIKLKFDKTIQKFSNAPTF